MKKVYFFKKYKIPTLQILILAYKDGTNMVLVVTQKEKKMGSWDPKSL
jgi:hypothetical protein